MPEPTEPADEPRRASTRKRKGDDSRPELDWRASCRVLAIDRARGVAVLAMVAWHTADGWLEPSAKRGAVHEITRFSGQLAAPLFLFLAGFSLALRAGSATGPGLPPVRNALFRRSAELILIGHLLNYANWLLDCLGVATAAGLAALVLGGAGGKAMWVALQRPERPTQRQVALFALGAALLGAAFAVTSPTAPTRAHALLRVDILHCIGASIAVVACLLSVPRRARGVVAAGLALLVTVITPIVARAPLETLLPSAVAPWVVRSTSSPDAAHLAAFPLLPWLAHALAGFAVGLVLAARLRRSAASRAQVGLWIGVGALAVALVVVFDERSPIGHAIVHALPWLGLTLRTATKASCVLLVIAVVGALPRAPALERLGHTSLPLYVLHLTFAYGIASRPLHATASAASWLTFFVLLILTLSLALEAGTRIRARAMRSSLSRLLALL